VSAIFNAKADTTARLAGLSLATQLPPHARKLYGGSLLSSVKVGDMVLSFSENDWNL
jgi:hypothetical protein